MGVEDKPLVAHSGKRQVASDMEEAVSYLISVALSAGLSDVARKLNDIHLELQCLQLASGEDERPERKSNIHH